MPMGHAGRSNPRGIRRERGHRSRGHSCAAGRQSDVDLRGPSIRDEITAEIDYRPPRIAVRHGLQETLARMEDDCLKKSLDNLRQLCEAA